MVAISSLTPALKGTNTVISAADEYGMTMSCSDEENYAFYQIPRETVEANPFLLYQLEKSVSVPFVWDAVCGPNWNQNYEEGLMNSSTALQVMDLRETTAYLAGGDVLLQLRHPHTVTFSPAEYSYVKHNGEIYTEIKLNLPHSKSLFIISDTEVNKPEIPSYIPVLN
jgi:hypothetical protein